MVNIIGEQYTKIKCSKDIELLDLFNDINNEEVKEAINEKKRVF